MDEPIIIETTLTKADYDALEEYVKALPEVANVKFRVRKIAASSALQHLPATWDMVVYLGKEILPHLGKDVETLGVSAAATWLTVKITKFVEARNEAKKKEIEAGKETPLLYDAYERVIKVEQKKR